MKKQMRLQDCDNDKVVWYIYSIWFLPLLELKYIEKILYNKPMHFPKYEKKFFKSD